MRTKFLVSIFCFDAVYFGAWVATAFEPTSPTSSILFHHRSQPTKSPMLSRRGGRREFHHELPSQWQPRIAHHSSHRRRGRTTNLHLAGEVWTAIDTFWKGYPYAAAAVTCGVKASAADLVAQKRQFRKEKMLEQKRRQQQKLDIGQVGNHKIKKQTDYLRNFAYLLCKSFVFAVSVLKSAPSYRLVLSTQLVLFLSIYRWKYISRRSTRIYL